MRSPRCVHYSSSGLGGTVGYQPGRGWSRSSVGPRWGGVRNVRASRTVHSVDYVGTIPCRFFGTGSVLFRRGDVRCRARSSCHGRCFAEPGRALDRRVSDTGCRLRGISIACDTIEQSRAGAGRIIARALTGVIESTLACGQHHPDAASENLYRALRTRPIHKRMIHQRGREDARGKAAAKHQAPKPSERCAGHG
jgi:hypothetical protein